MIEDLSDHGTSKESMNPSIPGEDASVPLMCHDLSDVGSLIQIQITPKERTLICIYISV